MNHAENLAFDIASELDALRLDDETRLLVGRAVARAIVNAEPDADEETIEAQLS